MLYKFKSKAAGDVIMLEPNGRQLLALICKGDTDNQAKGILEPVDMPAAIIALQHAVAQDDALRNSAKSLSESELEDAQPIALVSLRQRAAPFLDMIQRCHAANAPIVWGV